MGRPVIPGLQLAFRAATAGALAFALAQYLGMEHPVYAFITAVLVTDLSAAQTRKLAFPRLLGTVAGAVVGALGSEVLGPAPAWICLVTFGAMFATYLVGLEKAVRVAGYVCGVVMINYSGDAWFYAYHRSLETTFGIALAVAVSYVPKLLPSYEDDASAAAP